MGPSVMMQLRALEEEVGALSAEVTRLRLMVHRSAESEMQRQQLAAEVEALKAANEELKEQQRSLKPVSDPAGPPPTAPAANPVFGSGVDVALPAMFCGADGTARLFRAVMEAYPWLTPVEVKEAQQIVANERHLQEEERRLRHERRVERRELELRLEAEESMLDRQQRQRGTDGTRRELQMLAEPIRQHHMASGNVETAPVVSKPPLSLASVGKGPSLDPDVILPDTKSDVVPTTGVITPRPAPLQEIGGQLPRSASTPLSETNGAAPAPVAQRSPFTLAATAPSFGAGGGSIGGASGVLLGTRPSAKKAGASSSLMKKLRQGASSDDSDDAGVSGAGTPMVAPQQGSTRADDHFDF